MKLHKIKEQINGKIAILGFGKEGKSTLRFLKKIGSKNITVLDKNTIIKREEGINYVSGDNYLDNISDFDLIIKSPGISPYTNNLELLSDKITTQSEIFTNNYLGKIIGITGTKGKSTTSTILYLALHNAGYKVALVGNIGNPVLDEVDILGNDKYDYIVYEMSSYMLEGLDSELYIGFINNLYNCHLDWHNGKGNYVNAKLNILKRAKNQICNIELKDFMLDFPLITYFGDSTNFLYNDNNEFSINGKTVLIDKEFKINGIHNRINILGILAIIKQITSDKNSSEWIFSKLINGLRQTLESFNGLPHRIENIGEYKGIIFVDDAIATTPESTIAAIKTFEQKIGTLFLGGQDSGFIFDELVNNIVKYKIKNIVLFPDTGEKILGDLSRYKYGESFNINIKGLSINVLKTKSMESAVEFGYKNTLKGEICLLSNAAPSFSLWSGYIEKGNQFQELVKKLSNNY